MLREITFVLMLFLSATSLFAGKKVLYFTHEPGRWHEYTPQLAEFKLIAADAGWEITVSTGTLEGQIEKLRTPDFGKGFDAIVYNFCMAASTDSEACANLIKQTTENGVPATLIHCAMHSWWDSYKNGKAGALGPEYKGTAKAKAELVAKWRADHGDQPFPVWGDFTGVASINHGPKLNLTTSKLKADHPALKNFPESYTTTAGTELYNNEYIGEGVITILKGQQTVKGKAVEAIVMWEVPRGKSKIIGLTLGHSVEDWQDKEFRILLTDAVNYLMNK